MLYGWSCEDHADKMRRFYLLILFFLLLGTCTLGSSDEDEHDSKDEDGEEENPNRGDMRTGNENTEKKQKGKKCKKEKEKHMENPKNPKNTNKPSDCEEKRNGGNDRPVTSKMSTSTETPSSTSTGTPSSTSTGTPSSTSTGTPSSTSTGPPTRTSRSSPTGTPTRTPSSTSTGTPSSTSTGTPSSTPTGPPTRTSRSSPTGTPTSAPAGSDMVAIFVPLSIFLLLLVLLVAVFLWRCSDGSQCLRRFGGKNGNTAKIKPGSDVITIYAKASHPLDSEHPGERPLTGHIYQEISDVHMGASAPGSSYSTLGFPFQDQKAAAQPPADGQYSLVGLPAK